MKKAEFLALGKVGKGVFRLIPGFNPFRAKYIRGSLAQVILGLRATKLGWADKNLREMLTF